MTTFLVDGLGSDRLSGTAVAAFLAAVGFAGALAVQGGLGTLAATGVGVGRVEPVRPAGTLDGRRPRRDPGRP